MYQSEQYDQDHLVAELRSQGDGRLLPGGAEALAADWRKRGLPVSAATGDTRPQIAALVAKRLADPDPLTAAFIDPDGGKAKAKHPLRQRLTQLVDQGSLKPEAVDPVFAELTKIPQLVDSPAGAAREVAAYLAKRSSGQFLTEPRPTPHHIVQLQSTIRYEFPEVPRYRIADLAWELGESHGRPVDFTDDEHRTRVVAGYLKVTIAAEKFGASPIKPDDPRLKAKAPLVPREPAKSGSTVHSRF